MSFSMKRLFLQRQFGSMRATPSRKVGSSLVGSNVGAAEAASATMALHMTAAGRRWRGEVLGNPNFERTVLGCIEADFYNYEFIFWHF